jgi:hypothetical protein
MAASNHARIARGQDVFALKRILKLDRLRLRGPSGAQDEFCSPHRAKTYDEWRND